MTTDKILTAPRTTGFYIKLGQALALAMATIISSVLPEESYVIWDPPPHTHLSLISDLNPLLTPTSGPSHLLFLLLEALFLKYLYSQVSTWLPLLLLWSLYSNITCSLNSYLTSYLKFQPPPIVLFTHLVFFLNT